MKRKPPKKAKPKKAPAFVEAAPPPPPPRPFLETPIEEMNFEGGDTLRANLRMCGVRVAGDIETLGCTGVAQHGFDASAINELRLGLAGGGVGLPCFVPPTRFCLAHNTIGGLQEGQQPFHASQIVSISRELTKDEAGRVALTEAARRVQGKNLDERLAKTGDTLAGRELPKGFEVEESVGELSFAGRPLPSMPVVPSQLFHPYRCTEHPTTEWGCRYCVASLVIEGELEPQLLAESAPASNTEHYGVRGSQFLKHLAECEQENCENVIVYVQVARFKRKLTRETP